MSLKLLEKNFKSDVRSSGQSFYVKGKVSIYQPSDVEIQSYIRAAVSYKVILKKETVNSQLISVDCSCSLAKKGQLCKHIWGALIMVEQKKPEFLDSIRNLHQFAKLNTRGAAPKETLNVSSSHEAYLNKQKEYRKEQYQKQKQRHKEIKQFRKQETKSPEFPLEVELALKFFLENGFSLRESLSKEVVGTAMKKLARIFHPDVGGSHEEILELNRCAEILTKFAKS